MAGGRLTGTDLVVHVLYSEMFANRHRSNLKHKQKLELERAFVDRGGGCANLGPSEACFCRQARWVRPVWFSRGVFLLTGAVGAPTLALQKRALVDRRSATYSGFIFLAKAKANADRRRANAKAEAKA